MNLCPRVYGADMTDTDVMGYCREIQRQDGEACRKKGCPYCEAAEVVEDKAPAQDRPAPVQRGLF